MLFKFTVESNIRLSEFKCSTLILAPDQETAAYALYGELQKEFQIKSSYEEWKKNVEFKFTFESAREFKLKLDLTKRIFNIKIGNTLEQVVLSFTDIQNALQDRLKKENHDYYNWYDEDKTYLEEVMFTLLLKKLNIEEENKDNKKQFAFPDIIKAKSTFFSYCIAMDDKITLTGSAFKFDFSIAALDKKNELTISPIHLVADTLNRVEVIYKQLQKQCGENSEITKNFFNQFKTAIEKKERIFKHQKDIETFIKNMTVRIDNKNIHNITNIDMYTSPIVMSNNIQGPIISLKDEIQDSRYLDHPLLSNVIVHIKNKIAEKIGCDIKYITLEYQGKFSKDVSLFEYVKEGKFKTIPNEQAKINIIFRWLPVKNLEKIEDISYKNAKAECPLEIDFNLPNTLEAFEKLLKEKTGDANFANQCINELKKIHADNKRTDSPYLMSYAESLIDLGKKFQDMMYYDGYFLDTSKLQEGEKGTNPIRFIIQRSHKELSDIQNRIKLSKNSTEKRFLYKEYKNRKDIFELQLDALGRDKPKKTISLEITLKKASQEDADSTLNGQFNEIIGKYRGCEVYVVSREKLEQFKDKNVYVCIIENQPEFLTFKEKVGDIDVEKKIVLISEVYFKGKQVKIGDNKLFSKERFSIMENNKSLLLTNHQLQRLMTKNGGDEQYKKIQKTDKDKENLVEKLKKTASEFTGIDNKNITIKKDSGSDEEKGFVIESNLKEATMKISLNYSFYNVKCGFYCLAQLPSEKDYDNFNGDKFYVAVANGDKFSLFLIDKKAKVKFQEIKMDTEQTKLFKDKFDFTDEYLEKIQQLEKLRSLEDVEKANFKPFSVSGDECLSEQQLEYIEMITNSYLLPLSNKTVDIELDLNLPKTVGQIFQEIKSVGGDLIEEMLKNVFTRYYRNTSDPALLLLDGLDELNHKLSQSTYFSGQLYKKKEFKLYTNGVNKVNESLNSDVKDVKKENNQISIFEEKNEGKDEFSLTELVNQRKIKLEEENNKKIEEYISKLKQEVQFSIENYESELKKDVKSSDNNEVELDEIDINEGKENKKELENKEEEKIVEFIKGLEKEMKEKEDVFKNNLKIKMEKEIKQFENEVKLKNIAKTLTQKGKKELLQKIRDTCLNLREDSSTPTPWKDVITVLISLEENSKEYSYVLQFMQTHLQYTKEQLINFMNEVSTARKSLSSLNNNEEDNKEGKHCLIQ